MSEVNITLVVADLVIENTIFPDDMSVEDVISDIVVELNLPVINNETQKLIDYSLLLVEQNRTLQQGQTISNTGIKNGDTVRLISSEGAINIPTNDYAPFASEPIQNLRIFICHSSNDKQAVRHLYKELRQNGFAPWLDENELLPGQDWNLEIRRAVRNSNIVLVCLSRGSINKAGYIQKEIRYALDIADEQPEGSVFLIPLKLEECELPERLRQWQWVNYFEEQGPERLLKSLNMRATQLGLNSIIPVKVYIHALNRKHLYEVPSRALVGEVKERILKELGFPKANIYGEPIQYKIFSKVLGHTLREDLTFGQNGVVPGDTLSIGTVEMAG